MLFASGGRSSSHYIAPEIGLVQRFARKGCCCANGSAWAPASSASESITTPDSALHVNAELECRITKRIGIRLGVTAFVTAKWHNIYNRDFFITRPIEYIGRPKTSLTGTNYTLGLNIDL